MILSSMDGVYAGESTPSSIIGIRIFNQIGSLRGQLLLSEWRSSAAWRGFRQGMHGAWDSGARPGAGDIFSDRVGPGLMPISGERAFPGVVASVRSLHGRCFGNLGAYVDGATIEGRCVSAWTPVPFTPRVVLDPIGAAKR